MFYSAELLTKRGPLGKIWLAGNRNFSKLTKKAVLEANIPAYCDSVKDPVIALALRLRGILLLGIVYIYERKAKYLLADTTEVYIRVFRTFSGINATVDLAEPIARNITLPEPFLEPADALELLEWSGENDLILSMMPSADESAVMRGTRLNITGLGADAGEALVFLPTDDDSLVVRPTNLTLDQTIDGGAVEFGLEPMDEDLPVIEMPSTPGLMGALGDDTQLPELPSVQATPAKVPKKRKLQVDRSTIIPDEQYRKILASGDELVTERPVRRARAEQDPMDVFTIPNELQPFMRQFLEWSTSIPRDLSIERPRMGMTPQRMADEDGFEISNLDESFFAGGAPGPSAVPLDTLSEERSSSSMDSSKRARLFGEEDGFELREEMSDDSKRRRLQAGESVRLLTPGGEPVDSNDAWETSSDSSVRVPARTAQFMQYVRSKMPEDAKEGARVPPGLPGSDWAPAPFTGSGLAMHKIGTKRRDILAKTFYQCLLLAQTGHLRLRQTVDLSEEHLGERGPIELLPGPAFDRALVATNQSGTLAV